MDYSSRITLRPFDLSDVDDFLKWEGDDKVTHYLRWDTNVAVPHPWRQSICVDNRSIGYVSSKAESGSDQHSAHVGFAIGYEYWGQGIMTEAIRMRFHVEKVSIFSKVGGFGGGGECRVSESVGKSWIYKGGIRDMFVYSFLSTDKVAQ